ncbi:urease accessory protein UreD [Kineococcus sp. SYSU DK004]|uniref:urease accessory protein UreD n=1 Tax=Kineococcus sp. SYSU DK004 TaxID=3383125 RepID=UPI003D7EEF1C
MSGDHPPDPGVDLLLEPVGGRIRLQRNVSRWPSLVQKLFRDDTDPLCGTVVVQQSGGGLHPGDVRATRVVAAGGVRARVVGQGATLVHAVPGLPGPVETAQLTAAGGAVLVHHPEPRVVLPGAVHRARTALAVDAASTVVAVEAQVLHPACLDPASAADGGAGGGVDTRSVVEVRVGGELRAVDRTGVQGLPASVRRWPAQAVVHVVGALAVAPPLPVVSGSLAAVSALPGGAGWSARVVAADGLALRRSLDALLAATAAGLRPTGAARRARPASPPPSGCARPAS